MSDRLQLLHFDPHGKLDRFLRSWLPPELLSVGPADPYGVAGIHRPQPPRVDPATTERRNDAAVGMPAVPARRLPPRWAINSLWIPTGAIRCGIGLFLVPPEQGEFDRFEFPVGETVLHLRRLETYRITSDLSLLLAVDRRFEDRMRPVVIHEPASWEEILSAIPFSDRITGFEAPPVPPDRDAWSRHLPAGIVLDGLAACAGQRIVFDPSDETYRFQSACEADAATAERDFDTIVGGSSDAVPPKLGTISVSLPTASYGRLNPDLRREIRTRDGEGDIDVLLYATQPVDYHGASVANASDVQAVVDHLAQITREWFDYAVPYRVTLPPDAWQDMSGRDDWQWLIYEQDGKRYRPKIILASLPPDCLPVEFPIAAALASESSSSGSSSSAPPSSSSEPSSSSSEPSSSSSGSPSSSASSNASSESSESSQASESSVSSESSQPPSESWSGSDKSSAIVPASWSPTGYVALFIHEMPEVRFDDVVVITVPQEDQEIRIDPRFVEVCERGSIEVCGVAADKPILVGARAHTDKIRLRFGQQDPQHAVRLVLRLTGIRRGFAGKRFPRRTHEQFLANEAFINSAYPSDPKAE